MGITAISGPQVVYGIVVGSTGNVNEYNEERGPSLYDLGGGMADPRVQFYGYNPGDAVGTQTKGLYDQTGLIDYIPFTANSCSITLSTGNAPVSGSALTLNAISSNGAIATTLIAPETGAAVSVVAL